MCIIIYFKHAKIIFSNRSVQSKCSVHIQCSMYEYTRTTESFTFSLLTWNCFFLFHNRKINSFHIEIHEYFREFCKARRTHEKNTIPKKTQRMWNLNALCIFIHYSMDSTNNCFFLFSFSSFGWRNKIQRSLIEAYVDESFRKREKKNLKLNSMSDICWILI